MTRLLRIAVTSMLTVVLGISAGCGKADDPKPKIAKKKVAKKNKRAKRVVPEQSDSTTEPSEPGTIAFPNLGSKSDSSASRDLQPEMVAESEVATPKMAAVGQPPETPVGDSSPESPRSERPLGEGESSEQEGGSQERLVKEFATAALAKRPADDAKVNVLTLDEYAAQFQSDLKLHEKFKGQFIEVSGLACGFHYSGNFWRFMYLGPEDKPGVYETVPYFTIDPEPWAKVASGQKIKVRGWYVDSPGWVFEIADLGESTAINISADELVAQFSKNQDAAKTKYWGKGLVISGELLRKDTENNRLRFLVLKTRGKLAVTCNMPNTPKYIADRLEAGQSVKVYGELSLADDEQVSFAPAFIISPEPSAK